VCPETANPKTFTRMTTSEKVLLNCRTEFVENCRGLTRTKTITSIYYVTILGLSGTRELTVSLV